MANFAKTTEIDISSMHDVMEEETPKKNKWGVIIPVVLSLLIAFGIWMFATEKSTDIHTKTYEATVYDASGIPVENETVNVDVKGTYSQLADMKNKYIIVTKIVAENGDVSYSDPELSKGVKDSLKTVVLTFAD